MQNRQDSLADPCAQRVLRASPRDGGFSIIDLLVSMSVIALLMAILLPSLARTTEAARRVKCLSNVKQIGLATAMYVDDHDGFLPRSVFSEKAPAQLVPQDMQIAHLDDSDPNAWDGVGWLVAGQYINAPPIFYCPSHRGSHPEQRYAKRWATVDGEIVINYQYRFFPYNPMPLAEIPSASTTILSDGLRTIDDYNHVIGANMLKADMSAAWYEDVGGFIRELLPASEQDFAAARQVFVAWGALDLGHPPADTTKQFPGPNKASVRLIGEE